MNDSKGEWINDDPAVKEFLSMAKQYYTGAIKFIKNGRRSYIAKLEPNKLKMNDANCKEAYFELTREKKKNAFFLRLVEDHSDVYITLM